MAGNHFHNTTSRSGGVRSLPLFRAAAEVFGVRGVPVAPGVPGVPVPPPAAAPAYYPVRSRHPDDFAPAAPVDVTSAEYLAGMLQVAQNAQHGARKDYVRARAAIGLANRTGRPADKWNKTAAVFSAEQIARSKSLAFRSFNRASADLRAADRAVAAALAALALRVPGAAS